MIICGIDPGLETTGYAVVQSDRGLLTIHDAGVCRTDRRDALAQRLAHLEADVVGLLEQHDPAMMAVEQLYAHYKHPRTAILMGHARGVILAAAARAGIEVRSYNATQIKRFLTGNGRAGKRQMQQAVMQAFGLAQTPEPDDVADALAIALGGLQAIETESQEASSA